MMRITAIRPGDCRIEIEVENAIDTVSCIICERPSGQVVFADQVHVTDGAFTIGNLPNYVELCVKITPVNGEPALRERLFRCGFVPGSIVNYTHPQDDTYLPSGRCLGSPSLLRLPDGALLMMHDSFLSEATNKDCITFRSADDGNTWRYAGFLTGCTWATLFLHQTRLFALVNRTEDGRLAICESQDGGCSWIKYAPIEGKACRGPTPMAEYKGRLWATVGSGSSQTDHHSESMLSIALDADFTNPQNWILSARCPYDPTWPGTIIGDCEEHMEGNVVVSPEGRLLLFCRYQTRLGTPSHGKALVLEADPLCPERAPRFYAVVDFPINMSKFKIAWDPKTLLYYAAGNRITTDMLEQRNILSLVKSPDLIHWSLHRDLFNYCDNGWPEDEKDVGFQYPDFIIEGEDMLLLSRTAVNGAIRYHDSNYMTFHRIRNFRR